MNEITPADRLDALEYVLGQTLLALESESGAVHARLDRLETAMEHLLQKALPALPEEDMVESFNMDDLASVIQQSLSRIRADQSFATQQVVAIGLAMKKVLSLGGSLDCDPAIDLQSQSLAPSTTALDSTANSGQRSCQSVGLKSRRDT